MAGDSSVPSERQQQRLSGKGSESTSPIMAGKPRFGSLVMLFKRPQWKLDIDANLKLVVSLSISVLFCCCFCCFLCFFTLERERERVCVAQYLTSNSQQSDRGSLRQRLSNWKMSSATMHLTALQNQAKDGGWKSQACGLWLCLGHGHQSARPAEGRLLLQWNSQSWQRVSLWSWLWKLNQKQTVYKYTGLLQYSHVSWFGLTVRR